MNKQQAALELRKAIQMFLATMDVETQAESMLEVASVFPKYEVGKQYKVKDVFSYKENSVGDAQLYQVLIDHTSAEDWIPPLSTGLYKAIGVTEDGCPEWVQPLGATDAYSKGDVVSYKGELYESNIDANVWAPDVYGWTKR